MAVPGKKAGNQFSLSTTSIGSDEDMKVYCQPCDRVGPRHSAHGYCTNCSEHLCETCFTLHKRHTLSRHHTLLDKANMPQEMSSVTSSQSDNLTKPCPKHNIEMIKFYCHDHNALLCSVCVTLEHTRTSCNVNYIPDVSGQIINSNECRSILNTIHDMSKDVNGSLQDIKKMNDTSNKSLTDALKDIKRFRTQINNRLDELEKEIEEAAKAIQKENNRNITKAETECGAISKSLKANSDAIAHFNSAKQANDLFMELKLAEQMIKDYEKRISALTTFDVKSYRFEPNKAISNLLNKGKSMGTLKGLHLTLKPRQISYKDEINVKTSKDRGVCCITGMILLTPHLLIATDLHNKAAKIVDISKKSVLDQQKLDSGPWDISLVSHDEMAVTLPYKQTIQFMSVSTNKLKKKHTVKVDGLCHGISCHKDKMVVTFVYPAKVQILLINGTVLQTIQDGNTFEGSAYVTTYDDNIYVSDSRMKTITKLNWQGKVTNKYDCRSLPLGLTMSYDGSLFVCFFDDNAITEISDDFSKEQIVVNDIQYPQSICWSAETCTLYTSSDTSSGGYNNSIRIFKF